MNAFVDTLENDIIAGLARRRDTNTSEPENDITPEQRRRWEHIIERDLRDIAEGKPQKYITGDEFWGKLTAAVMRQYETV